MTDDVAAPWAEGVDVREMTHTDVDSRRGGDARVSDPSGDAHVLVETLRRKTDLKSKSEVCDRAFRVELAAAIDNWKVQFSREDFDVAYLIPPVGWVDEQEWERVDLVDESDVDTSKRSIGFATPAVVKDMAKEAVAEGSYLNITDIATDGLRRMTGRLDG